MATDRPSWAPETVDLERPNAARIYDYFLGGACNFERDREFARQYLSVMPGAETAARLNRAFLRRAVRFCLDQGIRQFLDIGSGIPTVGNVHEIAQEIEPNSRVLYVDNEPVAIAHSERLLDGNDRTDVLAADLCDPDTVLSSATQFLDLSEPVALLLVAVLHFIPDEAGPYEAVASYVRALAPGSLIVLSHGAANPILAEAAEPLNKQHATPGLGRTREQVRRLLTGTELVEPGIVWTPQWRPDVPEDVGEHPERSLVYAAVGRKP